MCLAQVRNLKSKSEMEHKLVAGNGLKGDREEATTLEEDRKRGREMFQGQDV